MRDEIRACSALMLRLDSSAKAVTQQMHAISGLLGIALAASQRGIERLDQDGLGCLGALAIFSLWNSRLRGPLGLLSIGT